MLSGLNMQTGMAHAAFAAAMRSTSRCKAFKEETAHQAGPCDICFASIICGLLARGGGNKLPTHLPALEKMLSQS